jgi:hypothetical protein
VIEIASISTDFAAYEARRREVFARLVPLRRSRRVRVGDLLNFEFENSETLQIQVQEMVYVERLSSPVDIAQEVEAYERLLPTPMSLVATMLIGLEDPAAVRQMLAELAGLQHAVSLELGGTRVGAVEILGPDEDPDSPSHTVSVHMLRFHFTQATRDAFRDPAVPAQLVVDHEAYSDATPISGETRLALLADLTLEPAQPHLPA